MSEREGQRAERPPPQRLGVLAVARLLDAAHRGADGFTNGRAGARVGAHWVRLFAIGTAVGCVARALRGPDGVVAVFTAGGSARHFPLPKHF